FPSCDGRSETTAPGPYHCTTSFWPGSICTDRSSVLTPESSFRTILSLWPSVGTGTPTSGDVMPRSIITPGALAFSSAIRPYGRSSLLTTIAQRNVIVAGLFGSTVAYSNVAISYFGVKQRPLYVPGATSNPLSGSLPVMRWRFTHSSLHGRLDDTSSVPSTSLSRASSP